MPDLSSSSPPPAAELPVAHALGEEHRQERTPDESREIVAPSSPRHPSCSSSLVQDALVRYPSSSLRHLVAPHGTLLSWSRHRGKPIQGLVVSRGMLDDLDDLGMHDGAAAVAAGIHGAGQTARDHRGRRRETEDTWIAEVGRGH